MKPVLAPLLLLLLLLLLVLVTQSRVHAQSDVQSQHSAVAQTPAAALMLVEASQPHQIDIRATIDSLSYDEYWTKTFDAIFAFADVNSDGMLDDDEIRLVPSARAVRLSLGTGFTSPVAALSSLREITSNGAAVCTREELNRYYRRHGAGVLPIGYGQLPNTRALTAALVQILDADRDGKLSQAEFQQAETSLRKLDTNDDELIGVGELVPNAAYPGNAAANVLQTGHRVSLSRDRGLELARFPVHSDSGDGTASSATSNPDVAVAASSVWELAVSEGLSAHPLTANLAATRLDSWSVVSSLPAQQEQLRREIAEATPEIPADSGENRSRNRRPSRAWLTPMVDRDRNGTASPAEIEQWLALQQQLSRGHLLVSVYFGAGLFELLDTNHDAGLSVRELRTAWQTLETRGCLHNDSLDPDQLPDVVLFVVSQGYADSLAKPSTSNVEWFRLMDRNNDSDVSRREFTGSPEAFQRLDRDNDGMISASEAKLMLD